MFKKNIRYIDVLIFAAIAVIGYKIVDNYSVYFNLIMKLVSVLSPFIYALIIAYILNPVMKLLERKCKFGRGASVTITYLVFTGVVILVGIFIIPSLIDSIISIAKDIPSYINKVQGWIDVVLKDEKIYGLLNDAGVLQSLASLSKEIGIVLVNLLEGAATSLLEITTNIVMLIFGYLISIYVLLDKERLIEGSKTCFTMIVGRKNGNRVLNVLKVYNKMIGVYIGTKAIDSIIIGVIALVGLIILKVPYAILLAIVVGFTNMIPYFGPFIGEVVGFLVCVFVSPLKAIIVFIFLFALQQFDAWYLDPKLIGGKVGVRPFFIILAVTVAGGFFGPIGMILASPTIATMKIYYDRRVEVFKKETLEEKLDEVK